MDFNTGFNTGYYNNSYGFVPPTNYGYQQYQQLQYQLYQQQLQYQFYHQQPYQQTAPPLQPNLNNLPMVLNPQSVQSDPQASGGISSHHQ